jgi:hypothetical protein
MCVDQSHQCNGAFYASVMVFIPEAANTLRPQPLSEQPFVVVIVIRIVTDVCGPGTFGLFIYSACLRGKARPRRVLSI